ncbi:hypothetical protein [Rhodococcus marinonascens]|uniref:hypothetical protein n=1 Tax=Rhodococcus marinonascens TaxID=38311 RepID=UPI0009339596|nr:hypothetical protein [Rhodococcus marinonascens]
MIPALFAGLCDDAALFPPSNTPMQDALPAHARHTSAPYTELVGPFVFPVARLGELAPGELKLSLTLPGGPATLESALAQLASVGGAEAVALEIAVPAEQPVGEFLSELGSVDALAPGLDVFVEIPRDGRRPGLLSALAGTPYAAKFRTGGVVAEAYPDEGELAAALHTVISAGVRFKATAGLHRAIRNTDPETGFEQHGFLNVLLATRQALGGGGVTELADTLAERDGARIAQKLRDLPEDLITLVRNSFRSFGTCSILEPLSDLVALQLVPSSILISADEGAPA